MNDETSTRDGQLLLTDLNTFLQVLGVKRSAETLVSLIGIIGLHVLALEAHKRAP